LTAQEYTMAITAACPQCGNSLKAPDQYAGKRVKCFKCNAFSILPTPGETAAEVPQQSNGHGAAAVKPLQQQAVPGAVRLAFWLGLAALVLGLAAALATRFSATAGAARVLAWLGILFGGGAITLAIAREECGFGLPFTGSAASLLSLALIVFWLGAAPGPGRGMARPGPQGPPDGRGQTDRNGGPPWARTKDASPRPASRR
jgi:hypothetical protein